jgi:glycosyltransferase involved in cell wall biosynthesis
LGKNCKRVHRCNKQNGTQKLKLLVGGSHEKFFHLKEFTDELQKLGNECRLVVDIDISTGFPSKKVSNWFQTTKKFNKLVEEFKPDAVFVDRPGHFALAALKAKLPLLVHMRGDYWSEIAWAKQTLHRSLKDRTSIWFKDRIAEKCFQNSKMILPICNYLKDIVKERYNKKIVATLYQGIDPHKWFPVNDTIKLKHPCVGLLQGAVIWGKTQEMLILPKVLEAMPDVTFYWVGDGPYREKILPILSKYSNFKWLGPMQYPDKVREYLSEIDVYALVSGIDMSPLTLQEAQLMSKPVVSTRVGGIPEIMKDGETGFLVEKGGAQGWIDKLTILVSDENKARHMGRTGREFVEKTFSWNIITKNFIDVTKQHV